MAKKRFLPSPTELVEARERAVDYRVTADRILREEEAWGVLAALEAAQGTMTVRQVCKTLDIDYSVYVQTLGSGLAWTREFAERVRHIQSVNMQGMREGFLRQVALRLQQSEEEDQLIEISELKELIKVQQAIDQMAEYPVKRRVKDGGAPQIGAEGTAGSEAAKEAALLGVSPKDGKDHPVPPRDPFALLSGSDGHDDDGDMAGDDEADE